MEDLSAKVAEHKKEIMRKTLTVPELAKVLGTSTNKARQLTHAKGFPVLVLGQTRLTIISRLDDWLENNFGKIF
jgi:excisionase family DNA binding protein